MKKTKSILLGLILISIAFSFTPSVIPQVGTYTFHGGAGNVKILKVRTVDSAGLTDLFGTDWADVIGIFGAGAINVGARSKSLVTGVNISAKYDSIFYGIYDVAEYNTSNWAFKTGEFNATPDTVGDIVITFYDPANLSYYIHTLWGGYPFYYNVNVSLHTAGAYLAQLPTPVAGYLENIVWEPKWESVGNSIVHNADVNDTAFFWGFKYLEACQEIWTYDETYGAWIAYEIKDDTGNIIYKFSIELSTLPAIPGYDILLLCITASGSIGIIYLLIKKKRLF